MPDLEISQLPALAGNALQSNDPVPLTDLSASETKKITVKDLIQFGVKLIDPGSIPGDRVTFALPAGSIGTLEIADNSITALKMADGSSGIVQAGPLPNGEYVGQLGVDTADNKLRVWDGGAWRGVKGAASINTITTSATGLVRIAAVTTGDRTALSGSIEPTTAAREFLAGPTGAAGVVTARPIVGSDLPVATSSTPGAVIVSGGGLKVDPTGNIDVDNAVTAESARSLATWNAHGLVTGGSPLTNADLPLAGVGQRGAVIPGPDISVSPTGELIIDNNVTAATYPKVTVGSTGLVTAGQQLDPSDIPSLDASKIATGTLAPSLIAGKTITRNMLADYAIAYIQEATPPTAGVPIGELWFQESTAQLSMWNGNSWFPVGQARLTAENLRYCGTVDADTNQITGVTKFGTGAGYAIGDTPRAATDQQIGVYFVVNNSGSNIVFVPGTSFDNGDWLLCNGAVAGTGWERIDTLSGGGGGGATNLRDLLDVTITAPQAGQLLVFSAGGQWINAAAPGAAGTTPPAGPTDGQLWVDTSVDPPVVKVYNASSTSWVEVGNQSPDASETVKGIIELATQVEVDAGVDAVRAVTPATLKQYVATVSPPLPDATTATKGVVQLADAAAITAGTAGRVVDAAQLKANVPVVPDATTTTKGVVQLADAAAIAGGTAGRVVDAAQLKANAPADATTTVKGIVQLADAAAITAGTAGLVVDAAQLKAAVPAVADASETVKGIIELATQAEVDAGVDVIRAVTPATLKQYVATASPPPPDATTSVKGIVQLADSAAVTAGTAGLVVTADQLKATNDAVATATGGGISGISGSAPISVTGSNTAKVVAVADATGSAKGVVQLADAAAIAAGTAGRVVDAAQLKAHVPAVADASETVKGIIELASQAEVNAGTDTVRAITPATLKQYVATASPPTPDATTSTKGIVQLADAAAVTAGTAGRVVDAAQLKAHVPTVPDASETVKGIVELATQAEVDAGTDTIRAVTPATLKQYVTASVPSAPDATTTTKGIVQLADATAIAAGTAGRVVDAAQLKANVPFDATTSIKGIVQLADAAAITNGTAGRVVDAAQLKAHTPTVPDATITTKGIVWLADSAAVAAGTVGRIIDAYQLHARTPDASETIKGIVELATETETTTGASKAVAVHPYGLRRALATLVPRDLSSLPTLA